MTIRFFFASFIFMKFNRETKENQDIFFSFQKQYVTKKEIGRFGADFWEKMMRVTRVQDVNGRAC